jgi:hypothetical protein
MKGFTSKTQKNLAEFTYTYKLQVRKRNGRFTLDLLLPFYLNRYSGEVYNHPFKDVRSLYSIIIQLILIVQT